MRFKLIILRNAMFIVLISAKFLWLVLLRTCVNGRTACSLAIVHNSFISDNESLNSFKPGVPFVGHRQTE